jgi:hypothetical protein
MEMSKKEEMNAGIDEAGIGQAVAGKAKVPNNVHSLPALTLTHSYPHNVSRSSYFLHAPNIRVFFFA